MQCLSGTLYLWQGGA
ncbi:hypothetical protein [Treponema bryantii]